MEDVGKAVIKYPGLLGTGINKIDRTIEFLKAAGVVEIAKVLCRHPQVHLIITSNLELSVSKDFGRIICLIHIYTFCNNSKCRSSRKIQSHACYYVLQILSLSLDGKVHTMTAFLKSDLLLDTAIINKTISIQPSIFTYSVEYNLRPKVIYFLSLGLGRREIGRYDEYRMLERSVSYQVVDFGVAAPLQSLEGS